MAAADEGFDFGAARSEWPEHWDADEKGWPSLGSTWRARRFPQMRVSVVQRGEVEVEALIYWDGDLDGLNRLFSYEPRARWAIGPNHMVQMPEGIGPPEPPDRESDGTARWRDESPLTVIFDRAQFGGPDTWHHANDPWEPLPFFEPIENWGDD